ncbi:HAMP domain-containing sensor histidine kinase [Clostridiaceae bacterium M8S5]|nr:HAMP domain-containing sensor histidine kinase [Clostridiaceae bacterium M8S5]
MNSIKKKLFFQVGSIVIILTIIMVLVNTYIYPIYYTNTQKKLLYKYYSIINNNVSNSYTESLKDFISIENRSNIDILIYNNDDEIYYSSRSYIKDELFDKILKPKPNKPSKNQKKLLRPPITITNQEHVNDYIEYIWANDIISGTKSLILTGKLDNGNNFDLRLPLIPIEINISMSNNFILLTGILLLLIGITSAYYLSKSFTKPILQMNSATNKMKQLNFDTKCEVTTNDEIGQLACSINELSIELAKTINSLHATNKELKKEIHLKNKIDEKRKRLLNNVSHELKSPLSLMHGYAEGLKYDVANSANRRNFYCDVIIDESRKMNQLVQDLLDINQIEFGDIKLNKSSFDIVEFVDYILKKYQLQFNNNDIKLVYTPIDAIYVTADILKCEVILTNYINNAIQYVNNKKIIKINIIEKHEHVKIEIYNTCNPIEQTELEKLWESFYKIDTSRTRDYASFGLGLSVVKAIQVADNNKYGANLESDGITFWFELDKSLDRETKENKFPT